MSGIEQQPTKVKTVVRTAPKGVIRLAQFSLWPDPDSVAGIDDHQRQKLAEATRTRIGALIGCPGSGRHSRSRSWSNSCEHLVESPPRESRFVPATGKAAARITEALQGAGIDLKASTIHSLLKSRNDGAGWSFEHDQDDPLPHQVIICDEHR